MEFSLTFTSAHVLRLDVTSETAILGLEVTWGTDGQALSLWKGHTMGQVQRVKIWIELSLKKNIIHLSRQPWALHKVTVQFWQFSLLQKLQQDLQFLTEYNAVIIDQLNRAIIEIVPESTPSVSDRVHYMPHYGVVQQDKSTSKLHVVNDASARSTRPFLNKCFYTGPKLINCKISQKNILQMTHVDT